MGEGKYCRDLDLFKNIIEERENLGYFPKHQSFNVIIVNSKRFEVEVLKKSFKGRDLIHCWLWQHKTPQVFLMKTSSLSSTNVHNLSILIKMPKLQSKKRWQLDFTNSGSLITLNISFYRFSFWSEQCQ